MIAVFRRPWDERASVRKGRKEQREKKEAQLDGTPPSLFFSPKLSSPSPRRYVVHSINKKPTGRQKSQAKKATSTTTAKTKTKTKQQPLSPLPFPRSSLSQILSQPLPLPSSPPPATSNALSLTLSTYSILLQLSSLALPQLPVGPNAKASPPLWEATSQS